MQYRNNKNQSSRAMTLVEIVLAMAIMAIIFAALVPQLRVIQNSWDSKVGASETLQNGRVLIDHLNRNLSTALRITAVSNPSQINGYIEFLDNDANNVRYAVNSISDYVEFGFIGSPSDLAGPVTKLQFTCYDATDLSTPITDVNAIRSVKVETSLTNPAMLDQDMNFSTQAYIRTNALPSVPGVSKLSEPWLEFDLLSGMEPALVHMSGTKYLCAYRGNSLDGYACILTVNPAGWSVSAASFLEYDTKQGMAPALAKIDDTNFLCAYNGPQSDGFACILYESVPGVLLKGPVLEFDTAECFYPALFQIDTQGDTHHYLCAYSDVAVSPSYVHLLVLTVKIIPSVMMELSSGPSISFGGSTTIHPALAKIDDTHYLCAYEGETGSDHLSAVVLTVNTGDWTITTETHYDFLGEVADFPTLAKIDDTHYLCAYHDSSYEGRAMVLTVNPADWSITMETPLDLDTKGMDPELCLIDNTDFLCAYRGPDDDGVAVVLTVNTSDWTISKGASFIFATSCQMPALCQIDLGHYLCAYTNYANIGYDGVLEIGVGIMP